MKVCFHKHTQIWLIWLLLLFPVLFFFYSTFLLWFFWLIVFISYNALCIVQALSDIAKTLGQTKWNFNVDPCSGQDRWIEDSDNNVTCNCDFLGGTVCHVVSMYVSLSLSHAHHIYNTTWTPNIYLPNQWTTGVLCNLFRRYPGGALAFRRPTKKQNQISLLLSNF